MPLRIDRVDIVLKDLVLNPDRSQPHIQCIHDGLRIGRCGVRSEVFDRLRQRALLTREVLKIIDKLTYAVSAPTRLAP